MVMGGGGGGISWSWIGLRSEIDYWNEELEKKVVFILFHFSVLQPYLRKFIIDVDQKCSRDSLSVLI